MLTEIKNRSDLIIIGAGIFGSAIAYYFKRDNPDKEVVIYERNEISSGNTGLAAALMSKVRPYYHVIPLSIETYRVIPELEKISGIVLPIQYNGAIHIAVKNENVKSLEIMAEMASKHRINWEHITPQMATKKVPWLNASNAQKIVFFPDEAVTDPYLLCMAFANAAKKIGVKFIKKTEVIELLKYENTITGIKTKEGVHFAETTVLAAGVWSTLLAYKAGITLPMAAVRSQYWITEESKQLFPSTSPTVLIPDAHFYSRPQGNSLLFGIREPFPSYADPDNLPDDIHLHSFNNDDGWEDLEESYTDLLPFFPDFEDIGIKDYIAGFSAYTPDNQFILGEVNGVDGLLLATGCSGAGISIAGGVGLGIACLAGKKNNPFDFSHYNYERFGSVDPMSKEHLIMCASARFRKISG